ncbi:MAG: VRR-NUC domain-containing protein [Granulosicoccus sp.]|nr:VRR-NUC domain-containing protein [Granulosicoccus sp.]
MEREHSKALKDTYYLANFHALVSFVFANYGDLLHSEEKNWYSTICRLPEPAQCLYIRLLTRRGSIFRVSRLDYPEIENLSLAATDLASSGLTSSTPSSELATLARCFTKAELVRLLRVEGADNLTRAELLENLTAGEKHVTDQHSNKLQGADQWVNVFGHQHLTLMQLCYFGNLYQDLSQFVLADLGAVRYADYTLDVEYRYFCTREQVDAHIRYYECCVLFDLADHRDATALLQLHKKLPEYPSEDEHLIRRIDRLRVTLARQLERLSELESALEVYRTCHHPPARERQVRILLSLSRQEQAIDVCQQMLDKPFNASERQIAESLMQRCRSASGLQVLTNRSFRPQASRLVLRKTEKRVEIAAKEYYQRQGECHYVENALFNSMLGLAIWDIVFHSIPGVFFNPYQVAPADFYLPSFILRRQQLLSDRLKELNSSATIEKLVMENYHRYHGIANPLVRWQRIDESLLHLSINRIPLNHWHPVFNNLLADLRENTSGMPDLIVFPDSGGYELIEIKGPGDSLQPKQRRWLQLFTQNQIPARVVHIGWSSATSIVERLN